MLYPVLLIEDFSAVESGAEGWFCLVLDRPGDAQPREQVEQKAMPALLLVLLLLLLFLGRLDGGGKKKKPTTTQEIR